MKNAAGHTWEEVEKKGSTMKKRTINFSLGSFKFGHVDDGCEGRGKILGD